MKPIESNQLKESDMHEDIANEDIRERLLVKCENSIRADNISSLLNEHNIALRLHDENSDPRMGAYGPVTGIAIYVYAKDYDKALSIIEPVLKEYNSTYMFCRKCGSENVTPIIRNDKYVNYLIWICLFFIIIPFIYFVLPRDLGLKSSLANIIALVMIVIGAILSPIVNRNHLNYKCQSCGKKFHH